MRIEDVKVGMSVSRLGSGVYGKVLDISYLNEEVYVYFEESHLVRWFSAAFLVEEEQEEDEYAFEQEISFEDMAEVLYMASLPDGEEIHELDSNELTEIASTFAWQKEVLKEAYPDGFVISWD